MIEAWERAALGPRGLDPGWGHTGHGVVFCREYGVFVFVSCAADYGVDGNALPVGELDFAWAGDAPDAWDGLDSAGSEVGDEGV